MAVFFQEYADGALAATCLDTRTGEAAQNRFHPSFVQAKRDRYFYPDADGGGWLVPFVQGFHAEIQRVDSLREAPRTVDDLWFVNTTPYEEKLAYFRPGVHRKDRKPVERMIVYDAKVRSFRIIACKALFAAIQKVTKKRAYSMQIWGNRLMVGSGMNELFLFDLDPEFKYTWRYFDTYRYTCLPVLRDNVVIYPHSSDFNIFLYTLRALTPPKATALIRESQVWFAISSCQKERGNLQEAVQALKHSINADSDQIEAYYELARTLLEDRRGMEAWKYAEFFFAMTPKSDPRRGTLWNDLIQSLGIVMRIPRGMYYHNMKDVRILADRKLFAITGPTEGENHLTFYHFEDPAKNWSCSEIDGHKVKRGDVCAIIARDADHLTLLVESAKWENHDQSLFARIHLDTHAITTARLGSLKRVSIEYYKTSEPLRADYDVGPQLFIDRDHPDQVVLVDPQALREVGRIQLPERCWLKKYGDNDSVGFDQVVAAVYEDRYVIGHITEALDSYYAIHSIDRETGKVLWTQHYPMDPKNHAKLRKRNFVHLGLHPVGDKVFLAHTRWDVAREAVLSLNTGEKEALGRYGLDAWYVYPSSSRQDFHQAEKHLNYPAGLMNRLGGTGGGSVLWEGGPGVVVNYTTSNIIVLFPDRYEQTPSAISSGSGIYTVGPYSMVKVYDRAKNDLFTYLLKTANLAANLGVKVDIPETLRIDCPLLNKRSDMTPRFGVR